MKELDRNFSEIFELVKQCDRSLREVIDKSKLLTTNVQTSILAYEQKKTNQNEPKQ